jgi:hypothetical protein
MSALQLILIASHILVAIIFYTDGKRTGNLEGRKAVRYYYEARDRQIKASR